MITPSQIRQKKISTVDGGGYDRNEVNELLLEIIEYMLRIKSFIAKWKSLQTE